MKLKLILVTIACSIAGCSSTQAQPNSKPTNIQVSSETSASVTTATPANIQLNSEAPASAAMVTPTDIHVNSEVPAVAPMAVAPVKDLVIPANEISKSSINSVSSFQCDGNKNYLFLGNGTVKNRYGNPIYRLHLCAGGKEEKSYEIVTGRSFTQQKNRNQSGTHSPLPNGKYRISSGLTQGMVVEVGRVSGLSVSQPFLPISPMFGTGRSALGIHVDPSYNKDPKEDGTSGCIGLTNPADFKSLWSDINQYQIRDLQVAINTKSSDYPDVANQR
jgi:L,D-transpeptidase catalytic domain